MSQTFIGRADRVIDAVDEFGDVIRALHAGLDDGEFVAAEPGHEIGLADAAAEADGDGFQQLVADHVPERVVDALEFVDVDIEHRQLPLGRCVGQFALELFVEQGAVRQVRQRVVMGEVGDAFLGATLFGDVFMGPHPAAVRQRLVNDLDRASVRRRDDHRIAMRDVAQHPRHILVDVAGERSGLLSMSDHIAETAARLDDFGRQAVEVEIALVADDEALGGIEQQQALRHVVDGGVEPLLFQRQPLPRRTVLLRELANDQKQQGHNRQHGQAGHRDQDDDLLAPVFQRRGSRRRRDDYDRKFSQRARGDHPVLAVHRTGQAGRGMGKLEYPLLAGRTVLEILADQLGDMGITGEQRAVAMVHGNGGAVSERHRGEKILEMGGFDAAADDAEELAVRPRDLARDHRRPHPGDAAVDRFDQHGRRLRAGLEVPEVGPVGDVDGRSGPCDRRIDQPAIRIDDVDAADIGQRVHLGLEHQMDVLGGHPAPVILHRRDPAGPHEGDQVLLDHFEVFELLIEVAGQQQYGVFQLTLAVAQRALAEIAGHDGGADGDRGDQQHATHDQPADRVATKDRRDPE